MKLGAFVALSLMAAASSAAQAADVYSAPTGGYKDGPPYVVANWAGYYAGVNGGYGWTSDQALDYQFNSGTWGPYSDPHQSLSQSGGFGGVELGRNWQSGRFVYGVETDFQVSAISGSVYGTNPSDTLDQVGVKSSLDWFGTVRGRLGYDFGPVLAYATGGFAYGRVEDDITYLSNFPHAMLRLSPVRLCIRFDTRRQHQNWLGRRRRS